MLLMALSPLAWASPPHLQTPDPQIRKPAAALGFEPGTDGKLASWEDLLAYYREVAENSPLVSIQDLGTTTEGRDLVALVIGEHANEGLNALWNRQRHLAMGTLPMEDLEATIRNHPAVVFIQGTLHSTEIGASVLMPELLVDLITAEDSTSRNIRENVLIVLVPSANPDGQDLVVSWYDDTLGTPHEGTSPPRLYHRYAGHDNNRDWFMLNLKETQLISDLLYHRIFPQVVLDIHQMGGSGPRMFVPPYSDPINPNIPPVLLRTINHVGAAMALHMSRQGLTGVVQDTTFDGWWHGGARSVPARHHMVGILTETASARLASPRFLDPGSLRGLGQGLPTNHAQGNYPDPWPGGWWRIGDIIKYQRASTRAVLQYAATHRRQLLMDQLALAKSSIQKGRGEAPFGWGFLPNGKNPGALARLADILQATGVQVLRTQRALTLGSQVWPEGSLLVPMSQPYRPHAKDLLERQEYPRLTLGRDGKVIRPYDAAGWTLPLQFNLDAIPMVSALPANAPVSPASAPYWNPDLITASPDQWLTLDLNHASDFKFLNQYLQAGGTAGWYPSPQVLRVLFPPSSRELIDKLVATIPVRLGGVGLDDPMRWAKSQTGLLVPARLADVAASGTGSPADDAPQVALPRTAILQPWPETMDGGWTRLVLEQYAFPVDILHPEDVATRDLTGSYDAILIPSTSISALVEGAGKRLPSPYNGGLETSGVRKLRAFVQAGGTLVTLGRGVQFGLMILNEHDAAPGGEELTWSYGRSHEGVAVPGSLLSMRIRPRHWLRGLGKDQVIYQSSGAVIRPPTRGQGPGGLMIDGRYPRAGDILESGFLEGSEHLNDQVVLAHQKLGSGTVYLFAFRPQHRGQSIGTFPILFRALQPGPKN